MHISWLDDAKKRLEEYQAWMDVTGSPLDEVSTLYRPPLELSARAQLTSPKKYWLSILR